MPITSRNGIKVQDGDPCTRQIDLQRIRLSPVIAAPVVWMLPSYASMFGTWEPLDWNVLLDARRSSWPLRQPFQCGPVGGGACPASCHRGNRIDARVEVVDDSSLRSRCAGL